MPAPLNEYRVRKNPYAPNVVYVERNPGARGGWSEVTHFGRRENLVAMHRAIGAFLAKEASDSR